MAAGVYGEKRIVYHDYPMEVFTADEIKTAWRHMPYSQGYMLAVTGVPALILHGRLEFCHTPPIATFVGRETIWETDIPDLNKPRYLVAGTYQIMYSRIVKKTDVIRIDGVPVVKLKALARLYADLDDLEARQIKKILKH